MTRQINELDLPSEHWWILPKGQLLTIEKESAGEVVRNNPDRFDMAKNVDLPSNSSYKRSALQKGAIYIEKEDPKTLHVIFRQPSDKAVNRLGSFVKDRKRRFKIVGLDGPVSEILRIPSDEFDKITSRADILNISRLRELQESYEDQVKSILG